MQSESKMKKAVQQTILFLTILAASTFAQTMADAQKAYVAGNWKEAAEAYEAACPKEPDSIRAECYLWNILALSQTGNTQSFKAAGKRLDSLIQTTSPQKAIYADLMMTSAQFRMYLGKYDKAADHLIQAIETSKPHHVAVLQKVCLAIKSKVKNETLDERCHQLNDSTALAAMQAQIKTAKPVEQATADSTPVPPPAEKKEPEPKIAPAAAPTSTATPAPKTAETSEYWTLQIGAFGTKSNAETLVANLQKRKINCSITELPRAERTLYLVQTGRFDTKEQAIDFAANKLVPIKIEYQPLLKK